MKRRTYKTNHKKSHRRTRKNNFTSCIISLVLIIICSCYFGSFFSSAQTNDISAEPVREKYYKSIEIQEGDSLWTIATNYMSEEYDSIYTYLNEILLINDISMASIDHIEAGDYLTIAYYK